jgi:hypothetical protein
MDFLTPIQQWAETQMEAEPGPASRSFSPPPFSILAWPSRTGPAEPASLARVACVRPSNRQCSPASLPGMPRLSTHTRPNKHTSDPLSTRPVINPLLTQYRVHLQTGFFPPSNPAPIFMIWSRFLEEIDWSPPQPRVRRIFTYK